MYLKQKDIFWAMGKGFVKKIMDISVTESYKQGEWLFNVGDPADAFYILLKGRIKLILGETGHVVYIVSNAGEAFGWSSLIGRGSFSTSAKCMTQTKLLKLPKDKLEKILEKDLANSLILFKRLAEILGNRLLQSYTIISTTSSTELSLALGSGQVMASPEPES
jgi:CRP-like cAMP-binding protein